MIAAIRRWQFWIGLAAAGAVAALLVTLLQDNDTNRYGLNNTDLTGYAALAEVLRDGGVDIHLTRSSEQTREALNQHDHADVVVVTSTWDVAEPLGVELASTERPVTWLADNPETMDAVLAQAEIAAAGEIPQGPAGTPEVLEAGNSCTVDPAVVAQRIQAPGWALATEQGCFSASDGFVLADTSAGLIFTAPEAFTNRRITDQGNAALALNLLGGSETLIWYAPSAADQTAESQWADPLQLLPTWALPVSLWLLGCGVIGLFVAGRRTGPVVSEPLPVEVPAGELSAGRARLYQQANAYQSSARTLRNAALLRLGTLLRLGSHPDPEAVIMAVSRHTGRDTDQVRELLTPQPLASNQEFLAYAQHLNQLYQQVQAQLRTPTRDALKE